MSATTRRIQTTGHLSLLTDQNSRAIIERRCEQSMLRMTPDQHRPGTGETPLTLQFVDTSCHCPTVCSHKLRQIRSHVAMTAHSRRRKQPAANKAPHKDRLLPNVTEHERSISTVDQCGRFKGLREIRPRLKGLPTQVAISMRPSLTHTVPATPFAWKLSNDEQFLFNFCKYPFSLCQLLF